MHHPIAITRQLLACITRLCVVAGFGLLAAACISIYSQPPLSQPSATVQYEPDTSAYGFSFQQVLSWTESPDCKKISFIGDHHPTTAALGIGGRKEFRVAAGQRVFFLAETLDRTVPQGSLNPFLGYSMIGKCSNVVSFEPVAGRQYALRQSYASMTCRLDVVDVANGFEAPFFERHRPSANCMRSR